MARTVRHRWAYTAWAWMVVFAAFHVYWLLGGRFGLAGPIPEPSLDVFTIAVAAMFAAGLVLSLATAHPWGRRLPARMLIAALWTACAVLTLRGLAGVVDDLVRTAGILPNGLTGLTLEQTLGTATPLTRARWAGRITDWYFTLGGLLFALAAVAQMREIVSSHERMETGHALVIRRSDLRTSRPWRRPRQRGRRGPRPRRSTVRQ
jgi:hypothetical protein